jgi:hypothetical protein
MLNIPYFEKSFQVQTNSSYFSIIVVLMQDGHTISFESINLQGHKWIYLIHEKDMTAVVHFLHNWRHFLLGKMFVLKTNNVVTTYFPMQLNFPPNQQRCQDFLVDFDMTIEYKLGRINVVANALRKNKQHVVLEEKENFLTSGKNHIHVLEKLCENIK